MTLLEECFNLLKIVSQSENRQWKPTIGVLLWAEICPSQAQMLGPNPLYLRMLLYIKIVFKEVIKIKEGL